MIEREAPGYAEAMRAESLAHTPLGILTRGVSGIAGRTLIVNFPGNPKAIDQLFPVVAPTLEHAAAPLRREGGRAPVTDRRAVARRRPCGARRRRRPTTSAAPTASARRCATSPSSSPPGRRSSSSAPTARASRRCCGCSPRCSARTPATRACSGRLVPGEGWAVRGRIGLLGHDPLLYRDLTGRENLRYHARLHGVDAGRVEELLDAVGMAQRADEPVRTLSRGMVQRLAVCRAVLHQPELLLLDEPRRQPRPGGGRAGRAAHRAVVGRDARGDQPRPGGRPRRGRPRARAARRPPRPAGARGARSTPAEIGALYP